MSDTVIKLLRTEIRRSQGRADQLKKMLKIAEKKRKARKKKAPGK